MYNLEKWDNDLRSGLRMLGCLVFAAGVVLGAVVASVLWWML